MHSDGTTTDPVCGMTFERADAPEQRTYGDETYFFCSIACAVKFDADAEGYLAALRKGITTTSVPSIPVQKPPSSSAQQPPSV